jgi:uncharacterized membrane protein
MKYFLAILFPPLAFIALGRPFSAVLNLALWATGFFTVVGFVFAMIWAFVQVSSDARRKEHKELMKAMKAQAAR